MEPFSQGFHTTDQCNTLALPNYHCISVESGHKIADQFSRVLVSREIQLGYTVKCQLVLNENEKCLIIWQGSHLRLFRFMGILLPKGNKGTCFGFKEKLTIKYA